MRNFSAEPSANDLQENLDRTRNHPHDRYPLLGLATATDAFETIVGEIEDPADVSHRTGV